MVLMSTTTPSISAEALLRGVSLSEEFDCDLGDSRRTARLQRVVEAMAREPAQSFPDMSDNPSEQEALYRLLRNRAATFEAIFKAHRESTAKRAVVLGEVLVVHDTTTFMSPRHDGHTRECLEAKSKDRQGFYGHVGLVVTPDGLRAPLGVATFEGYVHDRQVDEETKRFWNERFPVRQSEGTRWLGGMEAAEVGLQGCRVIHVADREADRNDVLRWGASAANRGLVIRAKRKARDANGTTLDDLLAKQPFLATRTITLNSRSLQNVPARSRTFLERPRREATLSFRACPTRLQPKDQTAIQLNVVEAVELKPPAGQEPVRWVLFTTEPIDTLQDVLRVVDIYRSRWLIEEFFKAVKTGCGYSKRQLDSARTLLVALALALSMAWQLLALRHLSRYGADVPATMVLTKLQLRILMLKHKELPWSSEPTVAEACVAIGRLGGHHRHRGSPGWIILGRGFDKLLTMEIGAQLVLTTHESEM